MMRLNSLYSHNVFLILPINLRASERNQVSVYVVFAALTELQEKLKPAGIR